MGVVVVVVFCFLFSVFVLMFPNKVVCCEFFGLPLEISGRIETHCVCFCRRAFPAIEASEKICLIQGSNACAEVDANICYDSMRHSTVPGKENNLKKIVTKI